MNDKYYRSSNKTPRYFIHDNHKSRSKKNRHVKDSKHKEIESKTPPLPSKNSSIRELLEKRKSIQNELDKISELQTRVKKQKFNKDNHDKHNNEKSQNMEAKSPLFKEDEFPNLDSEDEENIIEQRRKKRKQLLEKLSSHNVQDLTCLESTKSSNDEVPNQISSEQSSVCNSELKTADMFSEAEDFTSTNTNGTHNKYESSIQEPDNWDDEDGYYNIRIGDSIDNKRYIITSMLGKGVFANVIKAQDKDNALSDVAIKIVRNNDLIHKTSLKEVAILKKIRETDPDNKYHCVKFLRQFNHKGHLCIVLESLCMDLRCVIKKYGKHGGLNIKALVSYSRQLLVALRFLKKMGLVHADIKPDNILVNEKKNVLKLCDFGSATTVDDNETTSYLVSRFYRAPEIILGLPYSHGIDIWASACTIFEMTTGKIMFTGSSNNKMLKCIMDIKGKIPTRLIKKGKFKDQHFNYNNNFLLHKKDELSGREKFVEVTNITPARNLYDELKKSYKQLHGHDERKMMQLKDLIDNMTMIDPKYRFSVNDCLKHAFIQDEYHK